jgi:hypothetical protein
VSTERELMYQKAPMPDELRELVAGMRYRRGWRFRLIADLDREQASEGLTFHVVALVENSTPYNGMQAGDSFRVSHTFIVPAASYNRSSWKRWILDCLLKVEQHEACEFLELDGERCFRPHHSEGEDPYIIWMTSDTQTSDKTSREK